MRFLNRKNTVRKIVPRLYRHVMLAFIYGCFLQFTLLAGQPADTNVKQLKTPTADPGIMLPLKLIEFGGRSNKDIVQLLWTTSAETNVNHFELEKSTNGTNFVFINKQTGKGLSSGSAAYQAEDFKPSAGINYYRLKIVCNDGKFAYSKIIPVKYR